MLAWVSVAKKDGFSTNVWKGSPLTDRSNMKRKIIIILARCATSALRPGVLLERHRDSEARKIVITTRVVNESVSSNGLISSGAQHPDRKLAAKRKVRYRPAARSKEGQDSTTGSEVRQEAKREDEKNWNKKKKNTGIENKQK
jgi:hypothetical protein